MCGIAGVLQLDHGQPCPDALRKMVTIARHRGPDALEIALDGPLGLGHARLSIINLANGRQPMRSGDGSLMITFNGEIFNYRELRRDLLARGRRFRTQSDTEVVLQAYAEYGEACVQHFNGQWAFAIWDRQVRKLFLSRDRFGIRPLFFIPGSGRFLFASEIKSLFAFPGVRRQLDPLGLNQLFTLWTTLPPRTVFQGVQELPPGHNLTVHEGRIDCRPYWTLPYGGRMEDRRLDECQEQLYELLLDATRLRLRADVPVGAYLSGGLDSSVTTALAKQLAAGRLRSFSVTFADAEFDESQYQQQVVRWLDTEHQSLPCSDESLAEAMPAVIWHAEKPLLRTAPAPLFLLSRQVQEAGFKVVLTGEGADEMLGGYDIFKEAKVRRFCARQPGSASRAALLDRLYPYLPHMQSQPLSFRQAFFRSRPEELASPFFSHLPRWETTSQLKRMFSHELRDLLADHDVYADVRRQLPEDFPRWAPLCQAQYLETKILMPGYILSSQGDRMALAHGVEGRFPFLDHRLAEFAASLPPRWKMHGLNEKYLLKRALGHLVPPAVARRSKQPYRAPDAKRFFSSDRARATSAYIEELLDPERIGRTGVFHPAAVQGLLRKARQGNVVSTKDNMALVGILTTQLLAEQFVHNFSHPPPATDVWPGLPLAESPPQALPWPS